MASLIMLVSELLHPHKIQQHANKAYASAFSNSAVVSAAASSGFTHRRSSPPSNTESATTNTEAGQRGSIADDFENELAKSLVFVDLIWTLFGIGVLLLLLLLLLF